MTPTETFGAPTEKFPLIGSADEADVTVVYPQHPLRFAALVGTMCVSFANAVQFIGFANVIREAQIAFDAGTVAINALCTTYFFVFLVTCGPAVQLVRRGPGIRRMFLGAAALNVVSATVKLAAALWWPRYWLVALGQLLGAVSNGIVLPIPPVIAATWFADRSRTVATTLLAAADNGGIAVGMLLSPYVLRYFGVTRGQSVEHAFAWLFGIQAALSAVPLAILACVPARPPEPPSAAEALKRAEIRPPLSILVAVRDLLHEGRACFRQPSFGVFLFGAACAVGSAWALSGLLFQVLHPFGFSGTLVGWIAFAQIALGCVVSIPIGGAIGARLAFKPALVVCAASALLCVGGTVASLVTVTNTDSAPSWCVGVVFALFVALGIAQNVTTPTAFETAAELAFPTDESVPATLLMATGNIIGGTMTLLLPATLLQQGYTRKDSLAVLGVFAGILFAALLGMCIPRVQLRRIEHETHGQADDACSSGPIVE